MMLRKKFIQEIFSRETRIFSELIWKIRIQILITINIEKHKVKRFCAFFAKINTENKIIIQLKPLECKIEIIGTLKY